MYPSSVPMTTRPCLAPAELWVPLDQRCIRRIETPCRLVRTTVLSAHCARVAKRPGQSIRRLSSTETYLMSSIHAGKDVGGRREPGTGLLVCVCPDDLFLQHGTTEKSTCSLREKILLFEARYTAVGYVYPTARAAQVKIL